MVLFGLKRPLNPIKEPSRPHIKKAPPRFVDSGKFWQVDAGRVLLEADKSRITDHAILAQSYSHNSQYAYGKSSHKSVVNESFRPPVIEPYIANYPLNRIPTKTQTIWGRINADSGQINPSSCTNKGLQDVNKFITTRKKELKRDETPSWMNLNIPYSEKIQSERIIPDFKLNMKDLKIATSSGFESVYKTPVNHYDAGELDEKNVLKSSTAGFNSDTRFLNNIAHHELEDKHAKYSASSGMDISFIAAADIGRPVYDLEDNTIKHSVTSGFGGGSFTRNGDVNHNYEFDEKLSAGFEGITFLPGYEANNSGNVFSGKEKLFKEYKPHYTQTFDDKYKLTDHRKIIPVAKEKQESCSKYFGVKDTGTIPTHFAINKPNIKLRKK